MFPPLWQLIMVAVIGGASASVFGFIFSIVRDWREKKQRKIEEFGKLCDEFLKLVTDYWASPIDDDNRHEMRLLRNRILAMESLLSKFYAEHFEKNENMRAALGEAQGAVTRHNFADKKRDADPEKVMRTVYAIVNLRFSAYKEYSYFAEWLAKLRKRIKQ